MTDQPTELLPEHPDHPDHHRHAAPAPKGNGTRNLVIGLAIALFLVLIAIIIWLAFFRGGPGPGPTPTPTDSSATPTPTPTQTVSPPPLDPSTCNTDNSSVELGQPDSGAGTTMVALIFTNTSDAACTLEGFPVVEFVADGDGTQVGESATQNTDASPVQVITVEPGDSAASMLKITSAGNVCDPVEVDGFRVIPPGSSDAFFIETSDYPACDGDVSLLEVTAIDTN